MTKKFLMMAFAILAFTKATQAQQLIFCDDITNEKCKPIGEKKGWKLDNGQASFFMIIRLDSALTTSKLQYKLIRNGKSDKPYLINDIMGYEPNKVLPCLNTNIVINKNGDYDVYILDEDDKVITQGSFSITGSKGLSDL